MDSAALLAQVRDHLDNLLLATDFDGTLAPIVADPETSQPMEGAIAALGDLAARGAHIGVITGRDAATVMRLGGLDVIPGLIVEGLYGAERWHRGTLVTPDTPPAILALREDLPALLEARDVAHGVWVEDKRLSLVVHTRQSADPLAEQQRLLAPATELAERLGVELHQGRQVLEFRLPGFDKGTALQRLIDEVRPGAVLFAGDDVGDLPAFATVRNAAIPGWSVLVSSPETAELRDAADVAVDGPAGFVELLRGIARR